MIVIVRPDVPFFLDPDLHYATEVWSDDECFHIEICRRARFTEAVDDFDALTKGGPPMRVVMRQRSHVFRNYVPERLRKPADRRE